ncbi:unnamed protein product [Cylindrotheca closterium]|uniref:Complex 1 LYR protein n=1 Tax=Cylindrotheca closterium TaxID=2856 RepID=A0AAD2CR45_9STRA|nr:unnamed protein product [Cylindrotheca closterium]
MATPGYGRSQIIALYRSCRRSMLRIPDPAQREIYNTHLRASFRAKGQLFPESREAILAIDDAREQLDRMEYYHSIREEKERQQRLDLSSKQNGSPFPTESEGAKMNYTNATGVRNEVVRNWLGRTLPQLHSDDLAHYASRLVEDGFDSAEILETDLMEEDLDFMKKAHRRALIRVKGLDDTAVSKVE